MPLYCPPEDGDLLTKHVGEFMYGIFYVNYVYLSMCTYDNEAIIFKIFLNYSSVPQTYQEK